MQRSSWSKITAFLRHACPALPLLALAVMSPGCTSTGQAPPPDAATPFNVSLLQEGDLVRVAFPGATNLNTDLTIPLSGSITLPFAGEFKAAGRSTDELQQDILRVYGPQLQVKEVNVSLVSSSASVYVSGAVIRPGRLRLDRPLTVLEAIMESGGFVPTRARPSQVIVIRQVEGRQQVFRVDLAKSLQGDPTEPFYLRPSDVVQVPEKKWNF